MIPSTIGSGPCAGSRLRIGIVHGECRIVAADDLAVRAQVLHEGFGGKAAFLRHHVGRQPGHLRHACVERVAGGAFGRRPGHGGQVVGHGEFFRLGQRGAAESILALELGRRQRRQLQRRAQRGFVVAEGEPAFQHRRQHHDAGGHDALVALQRARHLGGAEAAIAFAEQIFRRRRAVVLGDVKRNRLRERVRVAADAPEMLGVVRLDCAAPAGADRIDQHQIGEAKPGIGIVAQRRGRCIAAAGPKIEEARADQAEMQEGGRRARPAVEHESERPVRCRALGDVGGVKHRRALVAGLVIESERPRGRGIASLPVGVSMEWSVTESPGSSRRTPLPVSCCAACAGSRWPPLGASCAAAEPRAAARTIASARREIEEIFMARRAPERPLRAPGKISACGNSADAAAGRAPVRRPCGGS